jgi:hypothetical protein
MRLNSACWHRHSRRLQQVEEARSRRGYTEAVIIHVRSAVVAKAMADLLVNKWEICASGMASLWCDFENNCYTPNWLSTSFS